MNTLSIEDRVLTGISLGESHFREFKSAYDRNPESEPRPRPAKDICRQVGQELVSFANADGGELLVGVEDDGSITGVPHKQGVIDLVASAFRTHVHQGTPLDTPVVRVLEVKGYAVIYFRVSKSVKHVHLTSDGRCLQRFDRENRPVPAEEIQAQRAEARSLEFDREFVPSATPQDLDLDLLEEIAGQVVPGYSAERLLQFFDLAEFGQERLLLRRAALILFAKDIVRWHPRAEVRFLSVRGNKLLTGEDYNVDHDETIRGNAVSLLEEGWNAWRPFLARTKLQPSGLFRESVIYPEDACREALINAIAHRDYSLEGRPTEIFMFEDRMDVRSPGGLLSGISVSDLKRLEGIHQSRNVFVARVLRELGYMREMGEGIRRIYASLRNNDFVDPDIDSDSSTFSITLHHRSVFSQADLRWLDGFPDLPLGKDEQRIMLLGRDGHLLSTAEIIETLNIIDTEDFRQLHERLRLKGLIYTAKKTSASRKRAIPRFKIRGPEAVREHLAELSRSLASVEPWEGPVPQSRVRRIRQLLGQETPYHEVVRSLQALGYLDDRRQPSSLLKGIWLTREIATPSKHPGKTSTQPENPEKKKASTVNPVLVGQVKTLGTGPFVFLRGEDGSDYYMHESALVSPNDWSELRLGTTVEFHVGERKISNKPRSAKRARILEDY